MFIIHRRRVIFEWKININNTFDLNISRRLHDDGTEKHVCKHVGFSLKRTRSYFCGKLKFEFVREVSEMCGPTIMFFIRHLQRVDYV